MTRGIRWRVLILQVGLIGIFGFGAALAFGLGSFVHNQIRDQLTAQQIYFPPQSEAVAGKSLDPAVYPDLQQYAGQQVVNGDQAQAYANGFIGRHLQHIAAGLTYSQVSAKAIANPKDTTLAAQVQTLFRGETLRGLLLNAYGWWTVGTYANYGGVGLAIAAFAVLVAMAVEIALVLSERRRVTAKAPRRGVAPREVAASA